MRAIVIAAVLGFMFSAGTSAEGVGNPNVDVCGLAGGAAELSQSMRQDGMPPDAAELYLYTVLMPASESAGVTEFQSRFIRYGWTFAWRQDPDENPRAVGNEIFQQCVTTHT